MEKKMIERKIVDEHESSSVEGSNVMRHGEPLSLSESDKHR